MFAANRTDARYCGVLTERQRECVGCGKRYRACRGLSRGARSWHTFTPEGKPICDVCKRVGHVARSCWLKRKSLGEKSSSKFRRSASEGKGSRVAGRLVHSVVSTRDDGSPVMVWHIPVSVDGVPLEAQLDCRASENVVSLETLKFVDKDLKLYKYFGSGFNSSSGKSGAIGMVWLPVVIGSRSEKLHCVVVKDLKEKLIIGLAGMSFLGMCINFATGDVRIAPRRRKKIDVVKDQTAEGRKTVELHEDCVLVRQAQRRRADKNDSTEAKRDLEDIRMNEESRNQIVKTEQVKKLAVEGVHSSDSRRGREMPNLKKEIVLKRGGGKEKDVMDMDCGDTEHESVKEDDSDEQDTARPLEDKSKGCVTGKSSKKASKVKHKKKKKKGKKGKKGKK